MCVFREEEEEEEERASRNRTTIDTVVQHEIGILEKLIISEVNIISLK
jgi:hypothetical protein